jgi:hypothetical protein
VNAWTQALAACANVSSQAPNPARRQTDIEKGDLGPCVAAPLFDLHSLYEGGRWDHIMTAPDVHVVFNTNFYFGDTASGAYPDAERQPGSAAERDGATPNRGLSASTPPRPEAAPAASSAEGEKATVPETTGAANSTG